MKRAARGFTLIETIVAMVVLAIAATGVIAMQGKMFNNISSIKDMQVSSRLMLECAEHALAVRRHAQNGYATVAATNGFGTNACGGITALAGYTVPTVTIADITSSACPSGYSCKTVTVTQGGLNSITVMLVDY